MCTDEQLARQSEMLGNHIASLLDALKIGSDEAFEYSEPYFVGGLGSTAGIQYHCRAPFQGDCEFWIDFASCGASAAQVVISMSPKTSGVDYTGLLVPAYNDGMMDGLVLNLPVSNTVPVDSGWYQVRNSENTVYVLIICNANSAGVNMQFRQKRK
jgi:hypothetical protein